MPKPQENFISTLNQMGFMTEFPDELSQEFIEFSSDSQKEVLEIGAAYGVATIPILENGGNVLANDLDQRHLNILKERTPERFRSNLELLPGKFPDEISLTENSLDGVLACRVLHFFTGDVINKSFQAVWSCLRPGGKFFVVCETPYVKTFAPFVPKFLENKSKKIQWPGSFNNVHEVCPELNKLIPGFMHLFDTDILKQVAEENGFFVEKVCYLSRKDFPSWVQLDGKESVGMIAVKQ